MKEIYSKKFEGLLSLFGIQALACIKINDYAKSPIYVDTSYFQKEGYLVVYIYQDDVDKVRKYVFGEIEKDCDYLNILADKTIKGFEFFLNKYEESIELIDKVNNPKELKEWIKLFLEFASNTTNPAFLIEMFAGYDNYWLNYFNISKPDFDILTSPEELSYSKEFSQELAKIKLNKSKKTVEELSNKYFWILNNYKQVDLVTPEYISGELEKMSTEEAEKLLLEENNYISDVLNKKQTTIQKLNLSDAQIKMLKLLSSFVLLQDKRKEVISKTNSLFVKACNKLLDFYGVSIMEREKIMISAFPTWFCDFDIEEIRQKTEESYICYFLPSDDRKVLSGLKALDVLKKIEEDIISKNSILEVKGQTAFKGKIKGIVRIVIKSEDFSKFTDGEILVTHMTRPEFVPLMKKASAIITDEGGITCHAAIVARELSKPCIIGTKNATQILKDGDLVEVDADNGVVRIIKDDKGQSDNKYILSKEVENIINKNLYNFRDDVYGVSDNWSFFLNEFVFNCLNKYQDRICFHDNKGGFLGFLNTEDSKKIARDEYYKNRKKTLSQLYEWVNKLELYNPEKLNDLNIVFEWNLYKKISKFWRWFGIGVAGKYFKSEVYHNNDIPDDVMIEINKIGELRNKLHVLANKKIFPSNRCIFVDYIAEKMNLDDNVAYFLSTENIDFFVKHKKLDISKEELIKRSKANNFIICFVKGKILTFFDESSGDYKILKEKILDHFKNKNEIKGSIAFKDSNTVKGRVFVDSYSYDASKKLDLNENFIYVCINTHPDLMSVLANHFCRGIICDQGGIASHASIISRELKIPCIVGTGNATHKLQTGDEIEMDMINGIIKIIKK